MIRLWWELICNGDKMKLEHEIISTTYAQRRNQMHHVFDNTFYNDWRNWTVRNHIFNDY